MDKIATGGGGGVGQFLLMVHDKVEANSGNHQMLVLCFAGKRKRN